MLISILAIGQDRYLDSYSISGQSGWVLPTNDYVKGENDIYQPITRIYTLSLRYERQTDGSRPWHQLYNYPSYGLGLYIADFNVKNQLGNPITLYGFFFCKDLRSAVISTIVLEMFLQITEFPHLQ